MTFDLTQTRIGIIGLGYVGLPLAVEFAKHFPTVGFDVNARRIADLERGQDSSLEVSAGELQAARGLTLSHHESALHACNVYIVTVPTPIDGHKRPDFTYLIRASETVGRTLGQGDVVIYESTVYPGATEEVCVPVIEAVSGKTYNRDFFAGYSPERINPGDKQHRVTNITKVTSGSTPEAAGFVDQLYRSIVSAGTHKAGSIRIAEAAKVIENTQRDVNIALINELAILFNRLGLDTQEVLAAAATKWNFLPFRPGLVGGHCIGVDPYYLTHKAQEIGYLPQMILAGRRINDGMGAYVVERVIKLMLTRRMHVAEANILILGLAFKENCPDIRNSRVIDIVRELQGYNARVDVYDPWANAEDTRHEYGITPIGKPDAGKYDALILAVAHDEFRAMGAQKLRALGKTPCVLFDVKGMLPADQTDGRL